MARNKAERSLSPPLPPSTPPAETETVLTAAAERRQLVILKRSKSWHRCREVAGGAAANCAALCCCCPAVLFDVLLAATVRVPAALCRQALKARAKRKEQAKRRKETSTDGGGPENAEVDAEVPLAATEEMAESIPSEKITEVEKDMLALFCNAGFWRSSSQTEDNRR
ncbi:uncharacterized protein LOC121992861 [Zingiber officinale]|uniref:Uncharacterized protein n=1 Tax=Zingiber officinale TaxID=94328 RepID=A0A8J5I985_ZINOF|nr:uncharacterized protein LOC121992861 [Zingiber officinale]KAG6530881.1 hypothetical protein ZIOFF_004643 [Zingiber officinale]